MFAFHRLKGNETGFKASSSPWGGEWTADCLPPGHVWRDGFISTACKYSHRVRIFTTYSSHYRDINFFDEGTC